MKRTTRREFLGGLAGSAAVALVPSTSTGAADPRLETTTIRMIEVPDICARAPLVIAQELLKAEGFTDVQPVKRANGLEGSNAVSRGEADFTISAVHQLITRIDAGEPVVLLGGVHVGCFELFGHEGVRSLRDLKGKRVGVTALGSGRHIFLASMVTHVGLDSRRDIRWIDRPAAEAMAMFTKGDLDAFMGFPPEPQELRARRVGHVVVNTTTDKPWSQYFCCVAMAHRDFVRRYPVATRHALRAIMKATTVCGLEPERAAKAGNDKGDAGGHEYALQAIKELPYARWRDYNPEDTVRFYALRLHEAGLIKSSPQKIIAQGTDWRFFNELKKELKG
ncbi:MAG TPA: ABC transporter substrate-binding protein [Candidatus Acidoferrum sp.]|nr:ABC transporter substrate-binding protein [Candidatus Acidoferrum sp.]